MKKLLFLLIVAVLLVAVPGQTATDKLLMETGDNLLLETGDKILLETGEAAGKPAYKKVIGGGIF